ncbi:bifunctional 2-polyprenyl-6-hydroxyphenol methylase/3-demethylubiquinol 3-O-methyltransferase UbiG [Gramella sp. KN1008]|uniref:class I SAM-dependent methyltransferase n=1 Tax=Gramella sp. KN1008 TaxID=2529298 RepID=UPI00103CD87C|nr:class I SAM-dependent methyltransferase [Gramella sp. KN1008]TBW28348.1 class I SAM-dependent methyltransferase [Gramella sp. KN1008]
MGKNKDIFGKAIKAFYEDNDRTDINVHSPDFEDDIIPIDYLFRNFEEMPPLEKKALELCKGKVLDVGCGAGSHSLYLENNRNLDCMAIDTSAGAIEIARKRGLKNAVCQDFFKLKHEKFDTILMLMNGSGIIGKLQNLKDFFEHSRTLLKAEGQILLDSSDLIYLYDDEIPEQEQYYGELQFQLSYKDYQSDFFDWLYIDPNLLRKKAEENNFSCKIADKGSHFDYLAVLKPL